MEREDRLFWGVLILIVLVLVVAGLGTALRQGRTSAEMTYLPDESVPENVVYNAYVAARRGDLERFLSYFRALPWRSPEKDVKVTGLYVDQIENGELRIGKAEVSDSKAIVPVTLIQQWSRGPFGTEIGVVEQKVRLEREGERWLIVTELPFVYPQFEVRPIPIPPGPGGD